MTKTYSHRAALILVSGALVVGVSACGGDDADTAPTDAFTVADTDLAPTSRCAREGHGFVLDAQVTNGQDSEASYVVTGTVQSAADRAYRATGDADVVTVPAGESADVHLDGFGADAPEDATCTITATRSTGES